MSWYRDYKEQWKKIIETIDLSMNRKPTEGEKSRQRI